MQRKWMSIVAVLVVAGILACGFLQPGTQADGVATIVAATLSAATAVPPTQEPSEPGPAGTPVSFPGGSLVIPQGLASGALSESVPAVAEQESAPGWDVAPAHTKLTLQGYVLQDKFHEPQVLIYPASAYAAVNETAAENMQQIRSAASNPAASPDPNALPHVSFFNAGSVFHARAAVVRFASGLGIRELTEYAQYAAPVNNTDLFYHFQGLSNDGKAYVVAILPITAPLLAPDSGQTAAVPLGGIVFPGFDNPDPAVLEGYYGSVSQLLNSTAAGDFAPSLIALDALIGSLTVTP